MDLEEIENMSCMEMVGCLTSDYNLQDIIKGKYEKETKELADKLAKTEVEELFNARKEGFQLEMLDTHDDNYRRLRYVRYADDFILGFMIQRTEIGKRCREYFLNLEKQWNSPDAVMARALQIADRKLELANQENNNLIETTAVQAKQIEEMKPKAKYCDVVP